MCITISAEWLQDAERDFVWYIILTLVFLVISVYLRLTFLPKVGYTYVERSSIVITQQRMHWTKCFVLTPLGYPHKLIILQSV